MKVNLTFKHLHKLTDFEGMEQGGFMVGTDSAITDILPVRSSTPSSVRYAMHRGEMIGALKYARDHNLRVWGVIHSHPDGPDGPSEEDLALRKRLPIKRGSVRAVWHPRSGTLTLFNQARVMAPITIKRPAWFRAISRLFFV